MSNLLSHASRICIALLLVGGIVVTLGQVVGIAIASPEVVTFLGTTGVNAIGIFAGLAGIFAFLRYYTKDGKADAAMVVEENK